MKKIELVFIVIIAFCIGCSKPLPNIPIPIPKGPQNLKDVIAFDNLGTTGKIVFQRIGPIEDSYTTIAVIELAKKTIKPIVTAGSNGVMVSPDGTKVAYTANSGINIQPYDTYVSPIEGGSWLNVSKMNGQDQFPSWSYDSKSLFFHFINSTTIHHKLYRTYVDPFNNFTSATEIFDFFNLFPSTQFHHSKENKLVFAASGLTGNKFYILDLTNSPSSYAELVNLKEINAGVYTPCWSPDGSKIAFAVMKTRLVPSSNPNSGGTIYPAGGKLYFYDLKNQKFNLVYEWDVPDRKGDWNGFNELSVCWSPDGSKLAFNLTKSEMTSHIYIINIDGTGLLQVTNEPNICDRSVSWSTK